MRGCAVRARARVCMCVCVCVSVCARARARARVCVRVVCVCCRLRKVCLMWDQLYESKMIRLGPVSLSWELSLWVLSVAWGLWCCCRAVLTGGRVFILLLPVFGSYLGPGVFHAGQMACIV